MHDDRQTAMSHLEAGEEILRGLPARRFDSHKGQNGVVAVIGGSRLYHGAPAMTGLAAYRTGVDLVYLFVPAPIVAPIRAISPALIVHPLPDYRITIGCANKILSWMPKVDACVIGPGAGRQKPEGMKKLVAELSADKVRLVIDADALQPEVVSNLGGREIVVTPHAGEFKRLFGVELVGELEARTEIVREAARSVGVTVLVKAHLDIISDGKSVAIDNSGTPAMTVGGTGDVLSGIVAALLAKGVEPFKAAVAAAYINGRSGERAGEKYGLRILPTDLIAELPNVLKQYDRIAKD